MNLLHQLDDSDEPIVISINGKVELAILVEGSFRMQIDLVDRLKLLEALQQAKPDLDEVKGLRRDSRVDRVLTLLP